MDIPFLTPLASCFFFVHLIKKNFVVNQPLNIPTELDSHWPSGFREEDSNVNVYGR